MVDDCEGPLAAELARAIAHDELELHYQPKLDRASHQVTAVEALVRWQHPLEGPIPPSRFVPIAERRDLIRRLTEWVIGAAVAQSAHWRRDGLALDIAINVSARDLEDIVLPDRIAALCRAAGVPVSSIALEITETMAMGDPVHTMDVLTRLRLKGFRLSIDDFGTGYSSLVRLRQLPISELKVDRSFVGQMLEDRDCHTIVEVVLGLAQKMGLRSVAEGVESAEILEAVFALGCDVAQGYHVSRPVVAARVPQLVASFRDLTPPRSLGSAA